MSWTVGLGEAGPGLRALAGGRALVAAEAADVLLWPARRRGVLPVSDVLNVIDLRGVEPGATVGLEGAGLLVVGSAAGFGAWVDRAGPVPIAVVPPEVVVAAGPSERMAALHVLVDGSGATEAGEAAEAAADWAAARGMACGVAEGPLGVVARLGTAPAMGDGAVVLDLRTGAGRIDASAALLALLAAGAPVLFTDDTPLRLALEGAGAGWRGESVVAGLERVAGLGAAAFGRASAAALGFARARFGGADAAFERAVEGALARQVAAGLARSGHVLVLSDEGPNLRHVRVEQPFDALVRRGAIGGYSVLCRGQFVSSTVPIAPALRFDAIWVQRSTDPALLLLLRTLGQPFVYDLDDHLLVSPSYRPSFEAAGVETAQAMLRECAAVSCATGRLAAGVGAGAKGIVTPNLAFGPARVVTGTARTVVWASSDVPALAESRRAVERAVRDFCRAHGLRLLCLGAAPPALFAAAGLAVEHVGLLPYPAYLARLRAAAPGILVGPMETAGDAATRAFVEAKSDIKVIEAGLAGLQGVFSRAAPYAESGLAPALLCDNDYESWMAALEQARVACQMPGPAQAWPARRDAAGAGLIPWAAAVRRSRADLSVADVMAGLRFVAAESATLLAAPALFDEADYLRRHPDVAAAVEAGGVASGYRHFVQSGFREGRAVRRVPTAAGEASFWWARLLHETSRLEAAVAARAGEIAGLRERLAVRRALPDPAPCEENAGGDDGWVQWGGGATRALPCPVCDAAGPHPVALSTGGSVLLRCAGCETCFYADRTVHDYVDDAAAAALLPFTLEQNASIHHQTRLLFGQAGATSVLDVGCGFGFAVDMAARVLGWRAVGVDPSWAGAAGRAQLGADIRTAYLAADTAVGAPFDRVIASEVIEHVAEPYAMLALLRGRLAQGGVLAVTTPNAGAIAAGLDRGRLLGILAPGVHLTLFSERSLGVALRQAGFAHVSVRATADQLVAEASDWPLRHDTAEEHGPAYRAYLEALLARAEVGSALWNGAAGRLLALVAGSEDCSALFDRVAAAWRERFGFDLAGLRLPPALSEAEIATIGAAALGRRQPFNLATVLFARARMGGPDVLGWAGAAYRVAVETRRVLQAENMVDLDLKRTAWEARLMLLRGLAALAPEVEGTLLQAGATASPGRRSDWDDAPAGAVIGAVAPFFVAAVAGDRFDEARRVEPWLADADAVAAALADDRALLLQTLFMRGVSLLIGHRDAAAALAAFERLGVEAQRLGARDYQAIAAEHVGLARAALSPV